MKKKHRVIEKVFLFSPQPTREEKEEKNKRRPLMTDLWHFHVTNVILDVWICARRQRTRVGVIHFSLSLSLSLSVLERVVAATFLAHRPYRGHLSQKLLRYIDRVGERQTNEWIEKANDGS